MKIGEMNSKEALLQIIQNQDSVSSNFYHQAVKIGNHAFIEFCGLMNEYTNMCRVTLEKGEDFTQANIHSGQALDAKDYQVRYFAEKFECIFGGIFTDKKNRDIFIEAMGWKDEEPQNDQQTGGGGE